jgi:ATP adenylyltransferase
VPFRHTGDLEDLTPQENGELQTMLQRSVRALREESGPDGFNVGMNLGSMSGAGIPDHLHWHVVPRWNGDTNFMPVVGEVRVLPELLAETARKLSPRFAVG